MCSEVCSKALLSARAAVVKLLATAMSAECDWAAMLSAGLQSASTHSTILQLSETVRCKSFIAPIIAVLTNTLSL